MKKVKIPEWLNKSTGVILAISYILGIYSIISMNMLPAILLTLIILPASLVVIFLVISCFKKTIPPLNNILLILISLLVIVVCANMYSINIATQSFFNNVQEGDYTYEEYSIIAKKDQNIKLAPASQQSMAIIKTDANNNLVKSEVTKYTKANYKDCDELTSLTVALDTKTANTAVINSSYLQLLSDNFNVFYQNIKVLKTFKIKIKNSTNTTKTDVSKPFVLYISGIDTFGGITTVSRSDVNILVVINSKTHNILLVNTPRDYYVQLHGTTGIRDKLTHAGIYGIDMSVKTMEDLYSTPINYYLRVNFSSLTKIIDTLGGVDVNSQYKFTADNYSFNVGINHLDGKQALAFSRDRHSFEGGDRTRGEDQQLVIEAIIAKMNNPSTLINYQQILASLQGSLQTNMGPNDMTALIKGQLNDMSDWIVKSISVDGTSSRNYTYSMGNMSLYVMEPDMATVNAAKQEIQEYLQ
jgi:LCP family protein required for cell wall assembly